MAAPKQDRPMSTSNLNTQKNRTEISLKAIQLFCSMHTHNHKTKMILVFKILSQIAYLCFFMTENVSQTICFRKLKQKKKI